MSTIELTAKIKELKELEAIIEQAQSEADAIKDAVKAYMTARGEEELSVDVFKVRYKTVTSSRVDTKKLKADFPEVAKACTIETASTRFTVA